jgi:hypothetical protein
MTWLGMRQLHWPCNATEYPPKLLTVFSLLCKP